MNAFLRITTLCAGLFTLAAQAGVSYTANPTGAAWIGSPNYVSANNANFATLSTAQGDPAITGANGVMAETFTPGSSFVLASFNLVMQITLATNFSIHLYDLGPAGTVSVNSSAATYTPGADLFSGLSFSPATTTGSVQGQFALSGADQVALLANEEYALEIWSPAGAQNGFLWYRGSIADPGGQMFSGGDDTTARNTLAGNGQAGGAPRTAGLALYSTVVPEPSAIALCGLGLLALIPRKRR
jgi:hypothetical protein